MNELAAAKQAADRQAALDALAAARKKLYDAAVAHAEAVRRHDEAVRKAGWRKDEKCTQGVLDCLGK